MDASQGIGSIIGAKDLLDPKKALERKEMVEPSPVPGSDQFTQDQKDKEIGDLKAQLKTLKSNAIKAYGAATFSAMAVTFALAAAFSGYGLVAVGLAGLSAVGNFVGNKFYKKIHNSGVAE